jgi:hypothetical protein
MKFATSSPLQIPVYFFGTRNFSWILPDDTCIKAYIASGVAGVIGKKKPSKDFQLALEGM